MAEWKSIFIREKNVKKSGSKAVLVACPYLSKYTGWSFWHPAKLVFDTDQQGVLRLKQISGLASLFADKEFSEAWK